MNPVFAGVYRWKDTVLVPTTARTDAGFYLEVEPVEVIREPTTDTVAAALRRVVSRGNPRVPAPPRGSFPSPVLLGHVRARTWNEFEKRASLWELEIGEDSAEITPTRRGPDGGFLDVADQRTTVSFSGSLEVLAEKLLSLIQAHSG